ncbi:hypothetical protein SDC9_189488 [bioreactor metagenome]|uniref:Uncharacterized protein n=1 Tax=bioreactor metagenome TaxID=1076179 RepID=A0A645I373_9ZZZZ
MYNGVPEILGVWQISCDQRTITIVIRRNTAHSIHFFKCAGIGFHNIHIDNKPAVML